MKRDCFAQWKLGLFVVLAAAAVGCKRSSAAQPPPSKPTPEFDPSDTPISPEPGISKKDATDRETLLAILKNRSAPLLHSNSMVEEDEAKTAFTRTFAPGDWLPKDLRGKIQVSETTCEPNGCFVNVTYPDWATFVALDNAILRHEPASPFMSFPGARYRTGRVESADHKAFASWVLAFRLRMPNDGAEHGHKEVK